MNRPRQAARERLLRQLTLSAVTLCMAVSLSSLSGCDILQSLTSDSGKRPEARVTGAEVGDLSLTSANLFFDVEVENPYGTAIPLSNVGYNLSSNGKSFVSGTAEVQGMVPAGGKKSLTLPAQVVFADLLSVLKGVEPGAVIPYSADFMLSVDVPAVGPLELPLKKTGELPIPTVPSVELGGIEWEKLSLSEATALLDVRVVNRNQFPVDLSKLSYTLSLGDVSVVNGALDSGTSFEGGGGGSLPIRASFSPRNLGFAAFNMLTGKGATYKLAGIMNCTTPFGALDLPYERSGETEFSSK